LFFLFQGCELVAMLALYLRSFSIMGLVKIFSMNGIPLFEASESRTKWFVFLYFILKFASFIFFINYS